MKIQPAFFVTFLQTLSLALLCGSSVSASASEPQPAGLLDGGFEESGKGWTQPKLQTTGVAFLKEAAKTGEKGLRVTDGDAATDIQVTAPPVPAEPGRKYRVAFSGRNVDGGRGLNVFIRFLDKDGKHIILPEGHRYHFMITEEHREWGRFEFDGVSPAGTAFAEVYIRTNKIAVITADIDDVEIRQVD